MNSGLSLEVIQLAQKFPAFFCNAKVLSRVFRSLLFVFVLSHVSPFHILPFYCYTQ